jgi:hypothetical protein
MTIRATVEDVRRPLRPIRGELVAVGVTALGYKFISSCMAFSGQVTIR